MAAADDTGAVDIKALLSATLEQRPHDDMSERVLARVAAMATLTEFARLIGAAPLSWLSAELEGDDERSAEEDDDDEDDEDVVDVDDAT